MPIITRAYPGLFGGVSQQDPAMRHPTQCAEQLNMVATVVDGLYKRPPVKHRATLPLTAPGYSIQGTGGNAFAHVIDRASGGLFQLVLVNGSLMLFDMETGAVQTVNAPAGLGYLSGATNPQEDFYAFTAADTTFIVNRRKVTAMGPAVEPTNSTRVAYVNVRTAVANTPYRVTINSTSVSFETGGTPTSSGIATSLRNALATALPGFTVLVLPDTNIIKVTHPTLAVTAKVSDGWSNTALQNLTEGVDKFADLPARFDTGFTVTIRGTPEVNATDPYFVKWDGAKWVEARQPGTTYAIDAATMPHRLIPTATAGTWTLEPIAWEPRLIGDDDTAKPPSFIGSTIQDVFLFRGRLGFLSGPNAILSRAGDYFNFWPKTAVQQLASDPIDLEAPAAENVTLASAVVYNETLLIWSTGRQQFALIGGDILQPETARLLPTTTFEADPAVRPAGMGNLVLFTARSGQWSRAMVYRVSEDTVTNDAPDITDHVPRYLPAGIRRLSVSTTNKVALVVPSAGPSLFVMKYELDDRGGFSQRAWQEFRMDPDARVLGTHWRGSVLYLLVHRSISGDTAGGRFFLESIDWDPKVTDPNLPFQVLLDRGTGSVTKTYDGATQRTTVDVPYLSTLPLKVLRLDPDEEPEDLTIVSQSPLPGTVQTRVVVQGQHNTATLVVGRPYTARYVFSEPLMKDANGVPVLASVLKWARVEVRYVNTGWFTAQVVPYLRETFTYEVNGRVLGVPGQGPSQLGLTTGQYTIPVHAKPSGTVVALQSDSYLPCLFPYAEWTGDVSMKASR